MKTLLPVTALLGLFVATSFGQVSSAPLRHARELNDQNNARQGVAPATQPARPTTAAPTVAKPAVLTPQQKITKLQADIAAIKPGATVTPTAKQQMVIDIAATARGTKPSTTSLMNFTTNLTAVLVIATFSPSQQEGLAKDIEAVVNSGGLQATQFNELIDHVQALLQVGTIKRSTAVEVASQLKTVGMEVRAGGTTTTSAKPVR